MTVPYAYKGKGHELDTKAAWDFIHDGYLLAPRTVFKGQTKHPRSKFPSILVGSKNFSLTLQETLLAAMGKVKDSRRAIMFSGGFDSMLIALLAKSAGAQVTAVTVQFDDFNPLTVQGSIQLADKLGIAHSVIKVKAVEFLSAFEILAGITDEPIMDLDLAVVYAAFKKYDAEIAGDVFISGMGSDQWFGNEALEDKRGNFDVRLNWANVNEQAHHKVAKIHQLKFIFPFLSESMLALSQSVPVSLKKDKKLLRALAVTNEIPHRGIKSEPYQVPSIMRHILIKTFGDRAWPTPVSPPFKSAVECDQKIRQIIIGLWLEKNKR